MPVNLENSVVAIGQEKVSFHSSPKEGHNKGQKQYGPNKRKQILRRDGKNTQKNCTKKDLNDTDNHDGMITHLKPENLKCEVKWALGSITMNKASRGDEISAELF